MHVGKAKIKDNSDQDSYCGSDGGGSDTDSYCDSDSEGESVEFIYNTGCMTYDSELTYE